MTTEERSTVTDGTDGRPVVVGVDFSELGDAALRFAVDFAAERNLHVRAVHAWTYPWWMSTPLGIGSPQTPEADEVHTRAGDQLASRVRNAVADATDIECVVRQGTPSHVLALEAEAASAVVIGSHGRSAMQRLLVSSTGVKLAGHIAAPLVIVPTETSGFGPERVVVGVDGSDNSSDALRWAIDHAHSRGIVAVNTWQLTPAPLPETDARRGVFEDAASTALDYAVEAVVGCDPAGQGVERQVRQGDARLVLASLGETASMLVVGPQGHTGLAHVVLGSVTSSLVHHPPCPLVVVPSSGQP